jgi:hypothetical protein
MDHRQTHQQDTSSLGILLEAITEHARLQMAINPSPAALMKTRDVAGAFDHLNRRIGRLHAAESNQDQ